MTENQTCSFQDEREFIRCALSEDTGDGDHTSLSTVSPAATGIAKVKVKASGIIAGLDIAKQVVQEVDTALETKINSSDGSPVNNGDIVMTIEGSTVSLLRAERLLLNFMQRMSGIATITRKYVDAVQNTGAKILDTRKTTPNFRVYEKAAVKAGGGFNHRFGLFDRILIKDNHVDAAGGITPAIEKANAYLRAQNKSLEIEIETRTIAEVREVMAAGNVNRIMLDNFTPALLKEAVDLIGKKYETEASGGITLETVREFAVTGVDFISVGALTHSYHSLDISMKIGK